MPVFSLNREPVFPPVELAEPEGLLAVGGDLSPERLLEGYRNGIFPWFSEWMPIHWWAPPVRMVLFPDEFHLSRSMRRFLNGEPFSFTMDTDFKRIIRTCAAIKRDGESGTWITKDMRKAYIRLHEMGYAHSVEVWAGRKPAGGLYGVMLNGIFFGESMFSAMTNGSKAALWHLCSKAPELGIRMIDCQFHTEHLESLGAREIDRDAFLKILGGPKG